MLVDDTTNIYVGETQIEKIYNGEISLYEKNPGYTKLNYIQTTGLQYLNTNYYPTYKTDYEIDMELTMPVSKSWQQIVASTMYNTADVKLFCASEVDNNVRAQIYDVPSTVVIMGSNNGRIKIRTEGSNIYYNDEFYYDLGRTRVGTETNPIWIASAPQQTNLTTAMKIYGFKMWEDGVLIRNYIPVLDSNNVPCLYDKVNKNYLYNAGRSVFLYG